MGTKAETIRVSARPAGFTLWTAAVSALAAAALIMSAVALTVAARDRAVTGVAGGGIHEAASTEALALERGQARRHGRPHARREHPDQRVRPALEREPSSRPWKAACSPRASGSRVTPRLDAAKLEPWKAVVRLGSSTLEPAVRAQVRSGGRADLERVAVRGRAQRSDSHPRIRVHRPWEGR